MPRLALAAVVAVAVLVSGLRAAASPIVVTFSATVTEAYDTGSITDGSIGVGSIVTGSLTFDPSAAPTSTDAFYYSYYDFSSPPWTLTAQVGNYSFTSVGNVIHVGVGNSAPADPVVDVFSAISIATNPGPIAHDQYSQASFGVVLVDLTASTLDSPSLAEVPLDLASWNDPELNLTMTSDLGEFETVVRVDSLSAAPAPEPAPLALLALALASIHARSSGRFRLRRLASSGSSARSSGSGT